MISLGGVRRGVMVAATALSVTACTPSAKLPVSAGMGPQPVLPPPETSLIPTANGVSAEGRAPEGEPMAAGGMSVVAFARGLDHTRWIYVLPNGDVLVAETNAPPRPE